MYAVISIFFLLADIQSHLSFQIKLIDTLVMAAAINATMEKSLKEIFGTSLKYFNWLYMEDTFDLTPSQTSPGFYVYAVQVF